MKNPSKAGHGINPGHGYMKLISIDEAGTVGAPVVFPSLVAPAQRGVEGATATIESIRADGANWWVGEDAVRTGSARSDLTQERLDSPVIIPALIRKAWSLQGHQEGPRGRYVTGLPAAWAAEREKCAKMAQRLRDAGVHIDDRIQVIPEPLGVLYALLLDADGEYSPMAGELRGRVGIIDVGHNTLDLMVIDGETPLYDTLASYHLGTATALGKIRARINAAYDLALTLYETDQALRTGHVLVGNQPRPLPSSWEDILLQTGRDAEQQIVEEWRSGGNLQAILIGGGGAHLAPLIASIRRRFEQGIVVDDAQTSVALGYAKLARRLARGA